MPKLANETQVGGSHYKKGGEEHWDRAWRLKYDPFQYIITKWVERWRDKAGVEDLKKAQHAIQKYIELVEAGKDPGTKSGWNSVDHEPWFNPEPETIPAFLPEKEARQAIPLQDGSGQTNWENIEREARQTEKEKMITQMKQTGWINFTYEGGTAAGDLYTCRLCKQEVRVGKNHAPTDYHECQAMKLETHT